MCICVLCAPKAAVISIMRAIIRVTDTAAVITGAVTQDNGDGEESCVTLDTRAHVHVVFRVKDGGRLSILKSNVCKHSSVSQGVGRR